MLLRGLTMLDEKVTEWVLSKLALTYGVRFHDLYAGMAPEMVRRNWAKELDGVSSEGIKYALRNLPEKFPPNVLEFRRLCMSRRDEAQRLALPAPRPRAMTPEDKAKLAKAMGPIRDAWAARERDPRAWARRLKQRELMCEKLTPAQREMWRAALREPTPSSDEATE